MVSKCIGTIPVHIIQKADKVLQNVSERHVGRKKLSSTKGCFSRRLNMNYRLLWLPNGEAVVCNHDTYQRWIKRCS